MTTKKMLIALFVVAMVWSCKTNPVGTMNSMLKEADELLMAAGKQTNVSKADFMKNLVDNKRFTAQQNVFFPSALAVDFKKKTVTLPAFIIFSINISPLWGYFPRISNFFDRSNPIFAFIIKNVNHTVGSVNCMDKVHFSNMCESCNSFTESCNTS